MNKQQLIDEIREYSEEGSELLKNQAQKEELTKNKLTAGKKIKIFLMIICSFLVPIIGFIYGLIMLNKKDKTSKIIGYTYFGTAALSVLLLSFVYRYILNKYL